MPGCDWFVLAFCRKGSEVFASSSLFSQTLKNLGDMLVLVRKSQKSDVNEGERGT